MAEMPADVSPAVEELWIAYLEEIRRDDAWESEFTASPYDPGRLRQLLASHGKRALPLLIRELGSDDDSAALACGVLDVMGARAAPEAVAPLVAYLRSRDPGRVLALWSVDQGAVLEHGFHRMVGAREILLHRLIFDRRTEAAPILSSLIDDPDEDVVCFGLRGPDRESPWRAIALRDPDLVPVARFRDLATSTRSAVADAAMQALAACRRPADVPLALSRAADGRFMPTLDDIAWLAPHPYSLVLLPGLVQQGHVSRELFQLVQRRRCAGLVTSPGPIRELLERAIAERDGDHNARARFNLAVELGRELRLVDLVAPPVATTASLAGADEHFLTGDIDGFPEGAWSDYAAVLLMEEDNAHAAFQLAWIDRAFGSVISPNRLAWLRALGFRDDDLLATLAAPPDWTIPASRSGARARATMFQEVAERVEQAGLPSLAARSYHQKQQREQWNDRWSGSIARAEAAAAEHIARVRAASAR
jgi:hypothetical protein